MRLGLAKITRYRPGVIWPALVVLLAGPGSAFYYKVGADELHYALLVKSLAGPDAMFEPTQVDTWRQSHKVQGLKSATLRTRIAEDLDDQAVYAGRSVLRADPAA